MEKEIIVRVLGRQYDEEDADEMEVVTTGIYQPEIQSKSWMGESGCGLPKKG